MDDTESELAITKAEDLMNGACDRMGGAQAVIAEASVILMTALIREVAALRDDLAKRTTGA